MPLKGVPYAIHAEFLYLLARMGHGDRLVIADSNFPSDSVAANCVCKDVVRVHGTTAEILQAVLQLMPLDQYDPEPLQVMDRVPADKQKDLHVPAYESIATAAMGLAKEDLSYIERYEFYEKAKKCFFVVQTDDTTLYANVIVAKGVI